MENKNENFFWAKTDNGQSIIDTNLSNWNFFGYHTSLDKPPGKWLSISQLK